MKRAARLLLVVVIALGCRSTAVSKWPYDAAENLIGTRAMRRARELYIQAAATDPDPARRDRALLRAADLDWYVFHDAASARTRLASIGAGSRERAKAWIELARLETELTHDDDAARRAATQALASARTSADRAEALTRGAAATVEQAMRSRLSGTCPNDAAALASAIADLRQAIELAGPLLEPSRLLLDAALMTGDNANVLQAWRWYYADRPAGVASAEGKLASATTRRSLVSALAQSRLYPEADLVLRDPCSAQKVPEDRETKDLVTYAAFLRRLTAITAEHDRSVAAGLDEETFETKVMQEAKTLWQSLTWDGPPPAFSPSDALAELGRRFGTIASLGQTDGIPNLLLGHSVVDETRDVEQYGHKAPLRFVQVDGMVSSGYMAWLTHESSGTGGWSGNDGSIYQIRPMYADGPVIRWSRIADPELRAETDRQTAEETRRDAERARGGSIVSLPGLDRRLQLQAIIELRDVLQGSGLTGAALRDAVIARLASDKFDSSIWAHEGRHAIDKTIFGIHDSAELEYRAKLSEIALARSPRMMSSILQPVGGDSPHGRANERVLTGVVAWMRAHAQEITGLDLSQPLLPQLDKLTDDQIRAAFRSLDPLAH